MWSPGAKVRLRRTVFTPVVAFGTRTISWAGALRSYFDVSSVQMTTDLAIIRVRLAQGDTCSQDKTRQNLRE
jgi:hypothetical protein